MRRDPLATARGRQPRPDLDNRPDPHRVSYTDTCLGHGGAGAWGMALSGGSSGCGTLRNPRSAQAILRQLGEEQISLLSTLQSYLFGTPPPEVGYLSFTAK